jgi:hypothetical protein
VRVLKLRRNPDCAVCSDHPTVTKLIDYEQFCGLGPTPPAEHPPHGMVDVRNAG